MQGPCIDPDHPTGAPTLDRLPGESIEALRSFGLPVAVITIATLLWRVTPAITRRALSWAA